MKSRLPVRPVHLLLKFKGSFAVKAVVLSALIFMQMCAGTKEKTESGTPEFFRISGPGCAPDADREDPAEPPSMHCRPGEEKPAFY